MRMQWLGKYREAGLLLMRVALGVLLVILTGPVLLSGPSRWARFGSGIRNLGIASNYQFWGFLGALAGCVGAALMIFGLCFRPGVLLVLALTLVHTVGAFDGFGTVRGNLAAIDLFVMMVGLLFVVPGKYSVDKS